jgi:uncharacterized protein YecE (DUF72 family)
LDVHPLPSRASGRRGNYGQSELDAWARRIDAWRARREVFAYFNNDWEGFAVENALALRERLFPSGRNGVSQRPDLSRLGSVDDERSPE